MDKDAQLRGLLPKQRPARPAPPPPDPTKPNTSNEPSWWEAVKGGLKSGLIGEQSYFSGAPNYYSYEQWKEDRQRKQEGKPPRWHGRRWQRRPSSNWLTRATRPRNPKTRK